MKATLRLALLAVMLSLPLLGRADVVNAGEDPKAKIEQLDSDIRVLVHDVEILRRDQTNYRIEKDLLKENYSTNLERINVVITIVFGIFGVIGYLGVRSIKEIQGEYAKELDMLRGVKAEFEEQLRSLASKQKTVESQVTDLAKTNEEQDRRLKVLEIIEKIGKITRERQWRWAQEYIDVGLGLDPENLELLQFKAMCYGKLGEFSRLIEVSNKILAVEPKNIAIVCNLLEAYALVKDPAFEDLYKRYEDEVSGISRGATSAYLLGLYRLMQGQVREAGEVLTHFAATCHERAAPYLGPTWAFDEVSMAIPNLPNGNQKTLVQKMVDFFRGAIKPDDLKKLLAAASQ